MKVVVDTNIVFSAILNSSSDLAKILINAGKDVEFYSCEFLKEELFQHRAKLKKLTKLTDEEISDLVGLATQNIYFINEQLISMEFRLKALQLTKDIDVSDAPFVSLSLQLNALLWTGDKKLKTGLSRRGFKDTIEAKSLLKMLMKQ